MAPSPSIEMLPITAVDRSVITGRISSLISIHTSTALPTSSTWVTAPISIPDSRTGVPPRTVATLSKRVLSG